MSPRGAWHSFLLSILPITITVRPQTSSEEHRYVQYLRTSRHRLRKLGYQVSLPNETPGATRGAIRASATGAHTRQPPQDRASPYRAGLTAVRRAIAGQTFRCALQRLERLASRAPWLCLRRRYHVQLTLYGMGAPVMGSGLVRRSNRRDVEGWKSPTRKE